MITYLREMLNQKDIDALKTLGAMHAYCERMLGAGSIHGSTTYYRCPWGNHEQDKLEIREWKGKGNCKCWACNQQGDIFDLAAVVLGLDLQTGFREIAKHVAQETGLPLRDEVGHYIVEEDTTRTLNQSSKQKIKEHRRLPKPKEMTERAALQAVKYAADNPHAMLNYAELLSLPHEVLMEHTKLANADNGLLGIDHSGHLLYLYSYRDDADSVRVLAVKQRGMPYESTRFRWLRHHPSQSLFGVHAVEKSKIVILTEGESDALAVRASLGAWLEYMALEAPEKEDKLENMFAVVAKPSAHISGVEWALPLRGKDVIMCVDNDNAGIEGAKGTIERLRSVGACRVYVWSPSDGKKDARSMYCQRQPDALMTDIIRKKKIVAQDIRNNLTTNAI